MSHSNTTQSPCWAVAACALSSGLLLALSFPPVDWTGLAWFALLPLGLVMRCPSLGTRGWSAVYLAGLGFHLSVLDWMRTLYGGTGLDGDYAPGWIIAGQLGAALFCLMVFAGRRAVGALGLPIAVVLPAAWISYEYLQCHVTAAFDYAGAPLVSLAYTQANNAIVAQLADLGGAPLISVVVAAANGCLFDLLIAAASRESVQNNPRPIVRYALIPVGLLFVVIYGHIRLNQKTNANGPIVCLMGMGDLPPLVDGKRIPGFAPTCDGRAALSSPDLYVWPELAYHHVLVSTDRMSLPGLNEACPLAEGNVAKYRNRVRSYLERTAQQLDAGMLIGCERLEVTGSDATIQRYNCLAFVDPAAGINGWYDKCQLAPFTEFSPSVGAWLQIERRKHFAVGHTAQPFVLRSSRDNRQFSIGSAICYDIAFEDHFRQQVRDADISLFVVAGSERADSAGALSETLLRMTQLRAIECRRPIVRNSHLGHSGLIDSTGQLVEMVDRAALDRPRSVGVVPLDDRVSLYSLTGNRLGPSVFTVFLLALIAPSIAAAWRVLVATAQLMRRRPLVRLVGDYVATGRRAFSLLELLVVLAIVGTITALLIPKVASSATRAKEAANDLNRAQINAAVERWYLDKGTWPENNLSDIGADPEYFPDGIPANPENNAAYRLNGTTHRVIDSGGGFGK